MRYARRGTPLNGTAQRAPEEVPPNPALDPRIGAVVGEKYRVERRVAEGGMGVVYAATNTWTRRAVALKFPLERRGDRGTLSATVVERFFREARAASRVEHPNAISVLDLGRDAEGEVFLVQELLEGETLAERLARSGPRPLAEVCALLLPAMDALCEAHRQGVVHRDLKPDNVFIARRHGRPDEAKVLDFGIAWLDDADPDERLTRAGGVVGTPAYMSPEQCRGAASIDARSDVWSVALLWFEALTGDRAFAAPSPNETIARVLTERVTLRIPGAPPALVAALQRAVAQRPDDRWPSMRAFADALALAAQASPPPSPRRRPARVAALVALSLLAALVTAAFALCAPPRAAQPTRRPALTPAPAPSPPAVRAPDAREVPPAAPSADRPALRGPSPAVVAPRAPQRARRADGARPRGRGQPLAHPRAPKRATLTPRRRAARYALDHLRAPRRGAGPRRHAPPRRRARRQGDDAAALAAFTAAYAALPDARAAAQLATTHQALGHWVEADRLLARGPRRRERPVDRPQPRRPRRCCRRDRPSPRHPRRGGRDRRGRGAPRRPRGRAPPARGPASHQRRRGHRHPPRVGAQQRRAARGGRARRASA